MSAAQAWGLTPSAWDAQPQEERETMLAHYRATTIPDPPKALSKRVAFGAAKAYAPPRKLRVKRTARRGPGNG